MAATQSNHQHALHKSNPGRTLVVQAFIDKLRASTRELSFKHQYVNFEKFIQGQIDLSSIVFDEDNRLVFQAGEEAVMNAAYVVGKRQPVHIAVLLLGTEYGLAVLHGLRDSYDQIQGKVYGEIPTIHAPLSLRSAAVRHALATGKLTKSSTPYADDVMLLEWVLSANFSAECAAQAKADTEAGVAVGDGMKIFQRQPFVPRAQRQKQRAA